MVSVPQKSRSVLFPVAWFGALLIAVYAPVIMRLVRQWIDDPDMGHGFFVPAVAAYIVWQTRAEWMDLPPAPSWWGLGLVGYGLVQLTIGTLGAELFLSRTAMLVTLAGMVLFMGGTQIARKLAFPLFLMFFMVPLPEMIYSRITFPLQLLASQLADLFLSILNIPVLREGNILELPQQRLSVVEACSGIRSLLSLTFLSLVHGYFFEKRLWVRVVLFASTIPIAIAANTFRVTMTGIMAQYKPELAEGFFHAASGWVVFMVAFSILFIFHQVLIRVVSLVTKRS